MLRKALLQGLLLVSGLTATLAAVAAGMLADDPPTTAGAPFSGVANVQSTTNFADGNRIVRTNTVRYFRDGQGRTRIERQGLSVQGIPTPLSAPMIVIKDPVSGQHINLLPKQKMATVFKLPSGGAFLRAAVAPCSDISIPFALPGMAMGMAIGAGPLTEASTSTTTLGQKSISGLNATGCRIVKTIPAGVLGNEKPITDTIEQWVSTDLGVIVQLSETSSIGANVTVSLEQVVLSEPDASLFTTPANYTVQNVDFPAPAAASGATVTATFTGAAVSPEPR